MTTKAMPPRPYQYAAYKHSMNRAQNIMLGDVLKEWRKKNNVSKKTLAYIATTIANSSQMPAKLTVADITNYEDGKWVKEKKFRVYSTEAGKWVWKTVPGHFDPTKRCQPKADKLALLVAATGMTPEQLTGYNPQAVVGVLKLRRAS